MKIAWSQVHGDFVLSDLVLEDAPIVKDSGFSFVSAGAQWHGDSDAVEKLKAKRLQLADSISITELALERFKDAGKQVLNAIEESRAVDSDIEIPIPRGLELLPFQRAGVAYAAKRSRVLFADEMGLGKSIETIAAINTRPGAHQILVVCPATLKINWIREFKKWTTKFLDFEIVSGTKPVNISANVVVINYDILRAHRAALREFNWDYVILDEVHYLKSKKADRTREVFGGIKRNEKKEIIDRVEPLTFKNILMLTGTPLNKPKELWPLLQVLDADGLGADWFSYAKRYCGLFEITRWNQQKQIKERVGWKWDGATNLEELQQIMRSRFMVRRLKKDVLKELPTKRRQVIVLEPKSALRKLVRKELLSYENYSPPNNFDPELVPNRAFDQLSQLRKEIALKKVPYAVEHIKEVLDETNKIVVWAHHHEVLSAIEESFKGNCVRVDGRVSLAERQSAIDRFQNDGDCKIFIGGIQAAGVGLTLTAASTVIFVELDWTPGNISQAEDRCHRIGQKESVLVQHIVLEGSLDERMVQVLIQKQEIIDKTLDRETAVCKDLV